MPVRGPCGNLTCKAPDRASGQWQYIPEDFDEQVRDDAICTCKKADCLRYFGLKAVNGETVPTGRWMDGRAEEGVASPVIFSPSPRRLPTLGPRTLAGALALTGLPLPVLVRAALH